LASHRFSWPLQRLRRAQFHETYHADLRILFAFLSPCVFIELGRIFDPADFEHGAQTTNNDRLRHAGHWH
jgi:hypothetical protein